jgi:hypothetical protein
VWYTRTAAHNTVEVDGENTRAAGGKTTLWIDRGTFRAIRASGPSLIGGERYERTAALIDISAADSYVVDIFRVAGGREHTKFVHSHFGKISTQGLSLEPAVETRFGELMRGFRRDADPDPVWSIDWAVDDHLEILREPRDIHVRYTDLTRGAEVMTAEGWVSVGQYGGTAEAWIPRILVRRGAAEPPLTSTFISVIEPYEGTPAIAGVRRLALRGPDGEPCADTHVALEIRLADGRRDLLVSIDAGKPVGHVVEEEMGLRFDGELSLVRLAPDGKPVELGWRGEGGGS